MYERIPYDPLASNLAIAQQYLDYYAPTDWKAVSAGAKAPSGKVYVPTPLVFRPMEANCFWEWEDGVPYRGMDEIKEWMDAKIQVLGPSERLKSLHIGLGGAGKTAFCWMLADRLIRRRGGRFFELLWSQISSPDDLADFMRGLEPMDIVFVDEVHQIKEKGGAEMLFHVLGDTGQPRFKHRDEEILVPPSVSWLAATTDPGQMDDLTGGPLLRRFWPHIRHGAPDVDTLVKIIMDRGVPIEERAAYEIAERSNGLPWQGIKLLEESYVFARVARQSEVRLEHALKALGVLGIDEHGLDEDDRAVIRALLRTPREVGGRIVYRMAKSGLPAVSGVDPATFERRVQPKLLHGGWITVMAGMQLTEKSLFHFGHLREE